MRRRSVGLIFVLLGVAVLVLGVAACGGETATETVTVTAPAAGGTSTGEADRGKVVEVELGESGRSISSSPISGQLTQAR